MERRPKFAPLFWALGVLLLTALTAWLCYRFADLPLACWIHEHVPVQEWKEHRYTGLVSLVCKVPWVTFLTLPFFLYFTLVRPSGEWFRKLGFFLLSMGVCGLCSALLKEVFGRARPYMYFRDGSYGFNLFHAAKDAFKSFPSGHSMESMTIALCFALIFPRCKALWFLFPLWMICDRMLLEKHYLGDTLCGLLIAVCYVILVRAYLCGPVFGLFKKMTFLPVSKEL